MECAYCKMEIDDDSYFCDQCGEEILICPTCKKPGKGKVCIWDGTKLVTKRNLEKDPSFIFKTVTTPKKESFSSFNIENNKDYNKQELHLINQSLNLNLKIEKETIIGRAEGDFINIFKQYDTVSRKHLKIEFIPEKGWFVTDLNSTNGTYYNQKKLTPMNSQLLENHSVLKIANLEFKIEIISDENDSTKTMRL